MSKTPDHLRKRSIRLDQVPDHPIYLFSLTAGEIQRVADVSRVSRDGLGKLIGYQRPEVRRHVNEMAAYLRRDHPLLPNPVILALSSRVTFSRSRGPAVDDGAAAAGVLDIPLPTGDGPKPAWVVDGQHRLLALARAGRGDYPLAVSGFVADDVATQREQFVRLNSARPLPAELITELLPEVSAELSPRLSAKRLPAAICDWLDTNPASPFHRLVVRPSGRGDRAGRCVSQSVLVAAIEESLSSPYGCLFTYRNLATGECDTQAVLALLVAYWSAVSRVFQNDWGAGCQRSRLMDAIGIRAMGRLMDRVMAWVRSDDANASRHAEEQLRRVAPVCRWSTGRWEELGGRAWDEMPNTARALRLLSNYLIRTYLAVSSGPN